MSTGNAVSLVEGGLFDKLSAIASLIRGDVRPFGGLQVPHPTNFYTSGSQ
jgi:hypothetical protein